MASGTNKLAFLSQAPPPGYVAGLGRGATGFTTRSDIGPAREGPSKGPDRGRPGESGGDGDEVAEGQKGEDYDNDEDDDGRNENAPDDQDPDNETGLFAGTVYERDDEEADRIWAAVDAHMDDRRRRKREQREREEMEKLRQERPKIQAQFADLKRGLSNVSEEEWANLPEAGNLTGKRRKAASKREARDTRSFAIPDSVLLGNRDRNAVQNSIDVAGGDGTATAMQGTVTNLIDIGEARNKIFSHKLDEAGSSASADGTASVLTGSSSTIDPKGYLTELSSTVSKTAAEIGDIKKARSLLDSVIKTNPKHAPGWIAAARLEEVAGKMAVARKVIAQGCEKCPKSEDAWLESARLNTRDNAKVILAQAVGHLSQSVKIWLKAAELENDANSKKRVLRKSLEYIPNSVKLWKELVNLEESPEDARILLSGAVAAVPQSVELWLALARLSDPKEAEAVLNQARAAIPTSHEIWIAAARLVEQQGEAASDSATTADALQKKLDTIIVAAVKRLTKAGAVLSREQWLKEAEQVESEGSPRTSTAIVKATIAMEIDEEDRQTVWVEDAQSCLDRGHVGTARAILAYTLRFFVDQASIWRIAADLERQHGTRETLQSLLESAVQSCPKSEALWLLYAKEKWRMDGDIQGTRKVLARAFDRNIGSEPISLEAAQLEYDYGERSAAGLLLKQARIEVGSARVWLKSALFERNEGRLSDSIALLRDAIEKFPTYWKFHLMLGQILFEQGREGSKDAGIKAAREAYTLGCRRCPQAVPLWLAGSRLEEQVGLSIRARALLEKARMANPKSDVLWNESAYVEERSDSVAQAKMLLSRGLQACPTSGLLNAHAILLEPRPSRKTKAADALKRTDDDARVLNLIGRLFWHEGKPDSARKWLERSVSADTDWGDGWAWWWKFEEAHGTRESQAAVLERCKRAQPRHGDAWQATMKDWRVSRRSIEEALELIATQNFKTIA